MYLTSMLTIAIPITLIVITSIDSAPNTGFIVDIALVVILAMIVIHAATEVVVLNQLALCNISMGITIATLKPSSLNNYPY